MDDACCCDALIATATPRVDSANIVRRSMSIFSRNGVETPEPVFSNPLAVIGTPKQMSNNQQSWLQRKKTERSDPNSLKHGRFKSPRGTILRAVPPAGLTRLSALEEEMARSPNDEISENNETLHDLPSCNTSGRSTVCRCSNSRIGVWVDGVVHWKEGQTSQTGPAVTESTSGWSMIPRIKAGGQTPSLSVLIPTGGIRPDDCTIHQPRPHRPLSVIMSDQCSTTPPFDRPRAPPRKQSPSPQRSRSSTSSSSVGEEASICSKRSSATSIEAPANIEERQPCSTDQKLRAPYHCGSRDCDATPCTSSFSVPRRSAPCTSSGRPLAQKSVCPLHADELSNLRGMKGNSLSARDADQASPTWSQAEQDLSRELSTALKKCTRSSGGPSGSRCEDGSIHRNGSVREVMQPPSCAPAIPKRSRKREWRTHIAYPALELQRRQSDVQPKASSLRGIDVLRKSISVSCSNPINRITASKQFVPTPPERSPRRPISYACDKDSLAAKALLGAAAARRRKAISIAMMPQVGAEEVLLNILARLASPKDLMNTAVINKGMYRVFKENEIQLLRTVLHNESPPSWELREWSPPGGRGVKVSDMGQNLEHSAQSYIGCYRNDIAVIERLKRLVLERCQSFLRRETVSALSTPTHSNAPRYNDAFWRIWTFCQIFGCDKNREDDITGQMDWLRGGLLANNEDCIASTEPNMEFDMRSVLISPPACFAEGNKGGLSASQLVDMSEIWTCMTVLLQSYHGRIEQARYYGVFDQSSVEEGDVEGEEMILEEWTAYLMTLGPIVVLEMAQLYPAAGFALAKDNGWTRWTPPMFSGSRTSFLKEPVAKSYEEQMVMAKQCLQDPRAQSQKDANRRRVATLAAEIRLRRQSSAFKRSPLIDMSMDRAMSMSSRRDSVSAMGDYSREASRRTSKVATVSGPRNSRTIDEERNESLGQWDGSGIAKDMDELAIEQLTSMGFERGMAIDALRITDRGDGLRPDRAIDLLLRQQS